METARTPNPDIELMRKADALVREIRERNSFAELPLRKERRVFSESEIGRYSSLQYYAEKDPLGNPDTLLGYFYREFKINTLYGPILVLLLMAGAWWFFGSGDGNELGSVLGLNATKFPMARYHCEQAGKQLPANADVIRERLPRLDEGRDRLGYWLADGRVYYPLTDETLRADERIHLYLCVAPE
jgi:hypothetical protein